MTTSNTYARQESEHENDFLKCFILKITYKYNLSSKKNLAIITFTNFYKKNLLELLISYLDPLKRLRKKKLLDFVISECVWRKYSLISERCHMM